MIDSDEAIIREIEKCFDDPLRFVHVFFPWEEPGTVLAEHEGPDKWQTETLEYIGAMVQAGDIEGALRIAVASGHGIGKTALISWILLWFISTRPHPQIIVTANTKSQLDTKTWREVAKWHKLLINKDWFEWSGTKFVLKAHRETWFAAAIPWSKERSDAFQGAHEKHILVLFDEASAIDPIIWDVVEGAMTTPGAMWIAFGNPTMTTGKFHECFHKQKHRWHCRNISAWDAKMTDKQHLQQLLDDRGEQSDFYKVRVLGQFPSQSTMQFISMDLVDAAVARVLHPSMIEGLPKIMSVDVARYGDDQSVLMLRQGLQILQIEKFRELDLMTLASVVAQRHEMWGPDALFVDGGGMGAGVVDRLRQLKLPTVDVQFGSASNTPVQYYNKRAEMWGKTKDWLKAGGSIPDDQDLRDDLIGPEYTITPKGQIKLERKQDMKDRGLASPDVADALVISFAEFVISEKLAEVSSGNVGSRVTKVAYDPFAKIERLAQQRNKANMNRLRRR